MMTFARTGLAYYAQHKFPAWGFDANFDANWLDETDSWAASLRLMKLAAMSHTDNMMVTVAEARAGWDLAHEALTELIREHIDRHQDMGTYLGSYAMDVAKGWKPKYLPGRKKAEFVLRDLIIHSLVQQVVKKFGVNEFRNETSSKPCGCSVVARAWREERHDKKMTEAAVVTIVTVINRRFPRARSNT
jgi:hypothetical protein